jgi:DNA-binding PadR family transcriptional regulator
VVLSYDVTLLYYSVVSHFKSVGEAGFDPTTGGVMGRTGLGEFEHQVLLAILRMGREAYSVSIVAELEARTGREVATSAVFVALRRLEKKGMLRSRLELPEESGEPYPRRYFSLTEAALEPLKEARRSYLALWEGLEPALDD